MTLRPASEPQPDLLLARLDPKTYREHHPEPADILLAVEVAQSSLRFDRKVKVPLYARSGIAEMWLVNLIEEEIVVHREPAGAWYGSIRIYRHGESLAPLAFPNVAFTVDDFLPSI